MSIGTLTKRAQFLAVRERGLEVSTKSIILQYLQQDEPRGETRVGFTASSRIGNAVVRNRVKRRLRAVVREVFGREKTPARAGYDYVLIGRKSTLARPHEGLVKDLVYALYQVKEPGKAQE